MRLKKVMATGLVAALALSTMVGCSSKKDSSDQKKIGVVQLVEHDALDASYKGFKDGLEKAGQSRQTLFVRYCHNFIYLIFLFCILREIPPGMKPVQIRSRAPGHLRQRVENVIIIPDSHGNRGCPQNS